MNFIISDATGGALIELRLHDGGSDAAPGPLISAVQFRTAAANPGNPMQLVVPFTPTAGSHTLRVRWRDSTGSRSYTLANNLVPLAARLLLS
jgi:hypothetical protein